MKIFTINALREALQDNKTILTLLISRERKDKRIEDLKKLCLNKKIKFLLVSQKEIDKEGSNNQGVYAKISDFKYSELENLPPSSNLILMLDQVTDTGNFGAIIRTATATNIDTIIIGKHNSATINEHVLRSSAGTLGKIPIIKVNNMGNALNYLKENNFWVVCSTGQAVKSFREVDYNYKTVIIMGSEEKGVSKNLMDKSDFLVKIPHSPKVESLNVSVATGVILFEVLRQRGGN